MIRTVHALAFDMDSTIIDSAGAIMETWREWSTEYGVEPPLLKAALGGRTLDTIAKLVPEESVAGALARHNEIAVKFDVTVRPVEGAKRFLESIAPGIWGVVTSSSSASATRRMEAAQLPIPQILVTGNDTLDGKPDPGPYARFLDLAGCNADLALAFEDSESGLASACSVGIEVVEVDIYGRSSSLPTGLKPLANFTRCRVIQAVDGVIEVEVR